MRMRTCWIISLAAFGLLFGAALVIHPPAKARVAIGELHQPSISIAQLTSAARNLPVESFDAF